jgi:hypothetical protein
LSPIELSISKAYGKDRAFLSAKAASKFVFKQGLWYLGDRVVVPAVENLQQEIIFMHHDTPYAGHLGVTKTKERVQARYYWAGMGRQIQDYVGSCLSCQRNKPRSFKPGGLLQPLSIPSRPWSSISTDFITGLPKTASGNEQICVWVDRLTKMVHFVAAPGEATAKDVARIFVDNIFKLHGLPLEIVSDRDPKFTSDFWAELMNILGVKRAMSTAAHPQTDGQTERINRVLEEMLRHYLSPTMDDWDQHLAVLEFAYNSAHQESISTSPFKLYCGLEPLTPASTLTDKMYKVPAVSEFVSELRRGLDKAKKCLQQAAFRSKSYADKGRRDVQLEVGQEVLLNTQNLRLKASTPRKFVPRFVGPFKVLAKLGSVAYRLDLPAAMKCHNVFHVSLLAPFKADSRYQPPPPTVQVDGELEYVISAVIDHKRWGRTQRKYLVRWLGYGPESDSWEPESYLENTEALHLYKLANGL